MCRPSNPTKAAVAASSPSFEDISSNKNDDDDDDGSRISKAAAAAAATSWISTKAEELFGNNSNNDNNTTLYYIVLAAIYVGVLPSSCFVNRGFTIWFHHVAIFYFLTGLRWQFLEKFQILSGTSICLGWYSSIVYDYVKYNRFFHPLYENMPPSMRQYMYLSVDDEQNVDNNPRALDFISTTSLTMMLISHVLDCIAHPLLTYYFWRRYAKRRRENGDEKHGQGQGSDNSNETGNALTVFSTFSVVHDVISSWEVILSAYVFSRCWSMFHTYYNFGQKFQDISLFYVGHDVYIINELDSWYPAYIAEGFVYGSAAIYSLVHSYNNNSSSENKTTKSSSASKPNIYETKPSLAYSESTLSTNSASSGLGLQ